MFRANHPCLVVAVIAGLLALTQCSSDDASRPDLALPLDSGRDGEPGHDGRTADASVDATIPKDVPAARDVTQPRDTRALSYSDGGCLTWESAQAICTPSFCQFSVSCGTSTSEGQCNINCTMGAVSGNCYGPSDAACVMDAAARQSCADLKACKWIL